MLMNLNGRSDDLLGQLVGGEVHLAPGEKRKRGLTTEARRTRSFQENKSSIEFFTGTYMSNPREIK